MPAIALQNVSLHYQGGVAAVRNCELQVNAGELLVIVGPSGCGKSTILRLIAGLEQPTAGCLLLGGKQTGNLPPRCRGVAMAFQSPVLYPHWTVARNLSAVHAGRLHRARRWFWPRQRPQRGVSVPAQERNELVAAFGLSELAGRMPSELSGGEYQRVALARTLLRCSAIALLDEPLGAADAPLRGALRAAVKAWQRRHGTTMVYVTHDPAEAIDLADRLAVMRRGRIEQVDRPDVVARRPANEFVMALLNSVPAVDFQAPGDSLSGKEGALPSELAEAYAFAPQGPT